MLTSSVPGFSKKKRLEPKSLSLLMNKNVTSNIFRCKEFAGSRAEKARGCFRSNLVSKIESCSFELQFQFKAAKYGIQNPKLVAQHCFVSSFWSMFLVFHLAGSTRGATKKFVAV